MMFLRNLIFSLTLFAGVVSLTGPSSASETNCAEIWPIFRSTYYFKSCGDYQPTTTDEIHIEEMHDSKILKLFQDMDYKSEDVYVDIEIKNVNINNRVSCIDYHYAESLARNFFKSSASEEYNLIIIISDKPISAQDSRQTGFIAPIATIKKKRDGTCRVLQDITTNLEIARVLATKDDDLYISVVFSATSGTNYDIAELAAASAAAVGGNIATGFAQVAPFIDPLLRFATSSETLARKQTRIDAFAGQQDATTGLKVVVTFGDNEFANFELIQKISEQGELQDKMYFFDAANDAKIIDKDNSLNLRTRSLRDVLKVNDSYPNFKEISDSLTRLEDSCRRVSMIASKHQFSNFATRKLLSLMMLRFYELNGPTGLESAAGYNVCLRHGERDLYRELVRTAPQAPRQCPMFKSNPVVSHVRSTVRTARNSLDELLAREIIDLGDLWRFPDNSVPINDQIRSVLERGEPNRCAINVGGRNSHGRGTPECTYLTSMVKDDDTRVWVAFRSYRQDGQIEIEDIVIGADPLQYTDLEQPFTQRNRDCRIWWADAVPAE